MKWANKYDVLLLAVAWLLLLPGIQEPVLAQSESPYSFIVAGHAYGAHSGENLGLHPPFLSSLDAGYDSTAAFIVLTGDIVNHSTSESWQQVEDELTDLGLPSYYVVGNHDNNDIGLQVFEDKFGGTYYSFYWQHELFIILNSTEEDRSISPLQIEFLDEQITLAGDSTRNIFIFFHEVLWNSHEIYSGVKSNSRSRYAQMLNYSNYWEEVHPMFLMEPEKNFFVITGDVGGNPDAIAAFYDRWDNVTLLSSGMGEVVDENYLLVRVHASDSVEVGLVPLDSELELSGLEYYSVPPAPDSILGPTSISPGGSTLAYSVQEVFNADTYTWVLPPGASGSSSSILIDVSFDAQFSEGEISVSAAREGFGMGPAASLMVRADFVPDFLTEAHAASFTTRILDRGDRLLIEYHPPGREKCSIQIFDLSGRNIPSQTSADYDGNIRVQIHKRDLCGGMILLSATTQSQHFVEKILVRL